jgi:hypothetical protein
MARTKEQARACKGGKTPRLILQKKAVCRKWPNNCVPSYFQKRSFPVDNTESVVIDLTVENDVEE